jgi:hypothetical protein
MPCVIDKKDGGSVSYYRYEKRAHGSGCVVYSKILSGKVDRTGIDLIGRTGGIKEGDGFHKTLENSGLSGTSGSD